MRIALAQLDATLGDVEANAASAREALIAAGAEGVDLVVFPELYLSGYALSGTGADCARTADEVAALARRPGPAAVIGFREASHNSAAYVESGHVVHVHRKVSLVDYAPFDEHELYEPGHELRAFDSPFGRLAILICNDAWHPSLASLAVQDGARVLLVPSCSSNAVPDAEACWRDLTRVYARLLECWVVFVNRVGTEAGFTYWGGSHVVDPYGEVTAEAPRAEEALVIADVDVARADERRRELPLLRRSRPDVLLAELERLNVAGVPT